MCAFKVVHLSPTPLVAAPAKIAKALRCVGHDAVAIALNDYPEKGGLYKKFSDDLIVMSNISPEKRLLVDKKISSADIIHVHNDLPREFASKLLSSNTRAKFVYQVHSPKREGPLYGDRPGSVGLPFDAFLVVAQYQPRHYPYYIAVPNLVDSSPGLSLRESGEKLRVIFSPSHSRQGRWNAKYSEKVENDLRALKTLGKIDLIWPESPLHPNELMALRKISHVTIDEVVTGAFHQISLEGLCAGNVTINRADFFSKLVFSKCTPNSELPPFVYADEWSLAEVILNLADDVGMTRDIQMKSYNYFNRNMQIDLQVKNFLEVYDAILK